MKIIALYLLWIVFTVPVIAQKDSPIETDPKFDSILNAQNDRLVKQTPWFDSANKAPDLMHQSNKMQKEQEHKETRSLIIRSSLIGAIVALGVLLNERRKRKQKRMPDK